jgi:hypothetical protein
MENLLAQLMGVDKFELQKEVGREEKTQRDLEYVKQCVLSEVKKIDMHRLRSTRYSEKATDDEEFSLTIAQFLYKIDSLSQKFERCISKIEKSFVETSPGINKFNEPRLNDDSFDRLKAENRTLYDRIHELENKSNLSFSRDRMGVSSTSY